MTKMHPVSMLLVVFILSFPIERSGADYEYCANACYGTYKQCEGICVMPADCYNCASKWDNCVTGCRKKREVAADLGAGDYSRKDEILTEFSLKKAANEKRKRMWNHLFYGKKQTA